MRAATRKLHALLYSQLPTGWPRSSSRMIASSAAISPRAAAAPARLGQARIAGAPALEEARFQRRGPGDRVEHADLAADLEQRLVAGLQFRRQG
jgi:hypothetical protein